VKRVRGVNVCVVLINRIPAQVHAMLHAHLATMAFAMWKPASSPHILIEVRPMCLDRLALPVYGTEHLLTLSREDGAESDRQLPILLRYREGELIEKFSNGQAGSTGAALGIELMARGDILSAAARRRLNPMQLMQMADGVSSFSEALLTCLSHNGWIPTGIELGTETGTGKARYREEVTNRDMGAFTAAAPSSVRVGEMVTMLRCVEAADGKDVLRVALEGPGEALLLSLYCAYRLPLLVASSLWEARAVTEERLPERLPDRALDLSRMAVKK
jgi:hypothetical protein